MLKTTSLRCICVIFVVSLALTALGCSPTPEKIFAKYGEATNPENIARPKSLLFKASISHESNFSAQSPMTPDSLLTRNTGGVRVHTITIYCEYPDKISFDGEAVLFAPSSAGFGERKVADVFVKQVFDGNTGWEVTSSPQYPSAGRTRQLNFYEVDKLKNTVDSAFATNMLDQIKEAKYLGEQVVEYSDPGNGSLVKKNTQVVEAFSKNGKKQTLYFDQEDGLLIKIEESDLLSDRKLTSTMSDYKQFGKVHLPSKIRMVPSGSDGQNETIVLSIEDLTLDAPQPEGAFVGPS